MKIYKYPIPIKDNFNIEMPSNAEILDFQSQDGQNFIWALVNEYNPIVIRDFSIIGTGHKIEANCSYIGTVQDDPFVWHLFENM